MRVRKLPPIRTWSEPIDDTVFAMIATCRETRVSKHWVRGTPGVPSHHAAHRSLYGLAVFVLVSANTGRFGYTAHEIGRQHLMTVLERDHHGRLPFIERTEEPDPV